RARMRTELPEAERGPAPARLDRAQALQQIVVRGDRLRITVRVVRRDALRQRADQEIRVRVQEEGRGIARLPRLLARRVHHPVRGRGIYVVGQALQHVADVDHDGV